MPATTTATTDTIDVLPVHDEKWSYDNDLKRIVGIGAWIGHQHGDPTPVTFLGLLAALLMEYEQVAKYHIQDLDHQVALLLMEQGIENEDNKGQILSEAKSGKFPRSVAPDRQYYSSSVRSLLTSACEYRSLLTADKILRSRDVLATYLLEGPHIHQSDFEKFPMDQWRARFVFSNASDVGAHTNPVTRQILLRAKQYRRVTKETGRDLNSRSVFYAVLNQGALEPGKEGSSVACCLLRQLLLHPTSGKIEHLFPEYSGIVEAQLPDVGQGIEEMSSNCVRLLLAAQEYSRIYFGSPHQIEDNGLVAALLRGVSPTIGEILQKGPLPLERLQTLFTAKQAEEDPSAGYLWQRLIARVGPPREDRLVSTFTADNPLDKRIEDKLDVESEARAFARIAAAKKIIPPLAIGVFGEWGSGKTFFMQLLERHVDYLSDQARQGNNDALFHGDIVQIRFNAWHYMETNLWASLVDYIFKELDRWLCVKKEDASEGDKLFNQLDTARQLQLESVRGLITAKREEKRLEEQLTKAQNDYAAKLQIYQVTTKDAFLAAVRVALSVEQEKIQKAATDLGLPRLEKDAKDLGNRVQLLQKEFQQSGLLLRSAVNLLGQMSMCVVLLILFVIVPAAMLGLTRFLPDDWAAWVRSLTGSFSYYLIALSGVVTYIVSAIARSRITLQGFLDRVQSKIEDGTTKERENIEKAAQDLAEQRKQLDRANQQFQQSVRRTEQALQEWQGSTARARLNQFIRAKVVGGDYAKHLGIIATIRGDFEQLAKMMEAIVAKKTAEVEQERAAQAYKMEVDRLLAETKELLAKTDENLWQEIEAKLKASMVQNPEVLKSFQRIILYIDDLDRCPPEKVVDVLQAIHLLLCFQLFVVVVAVDARWVSRALNKVFPDLLEEGVIVPDGPNQQKGTGETNGREVGMSGTDQKRIGASSQDYLEKIFQIPYWVQPMEKRAARKYVGWLVRRDRTAEESKDGMQQNGSGQKTETRNVSVDAQTQQQSRIDQKQSNVNVGGNEQGTEKSTPGQAGSNPMHVASGSEELQRRHVVEGLLLSQFEEDFLSSLAPFTGGSPRRGLRFVNSYRLVKTSLKPYQLDILVGDEGKQPGYRAIITHLAITTGAPHVAQYYFQEIMTGQATDLTKLIQILEKDQRMTRMKEEWQNLKGALETLNAQNQTAGMDTGEAMLETLRNYAPIASRYSFTARPH